MRLNLVHFDDALIRQPLFRAAGAKVGGREHDLRDIGPEVRLWARAQALADLKERLAPMLDGRDVNKPLVTWMGSGDFHHVTALIVTALAKASAAPMTVIAFDNHPDWVAFRGGLHCGSWAKSVLDDAVVDRVVGIGTASRDLAWPEFKGAGLEHVAAGRLVLFPMRGSANIVFGNYGQGWGHAQSGRRLAWKALSSVFANSDVERVLSAIQTDAIYITIDKDVLVAEDAGTNWDQGRIMLPDLLLWIRALAARFKVAGVDVIGDHSRPQFKGSKLSRILKYGEILVDHPRQRRDETATAALNQRTNLAILKTLEEVSC